MKRLTQALLISLTSLLIFSCGSKDEDSNTGAAISGDIDALFSAVLENDAETIAGLARGGINLSEADGSGRTALHAAAEAGKLDAVTALIEKGANIDAVDSEGVTPLLLATRAGEVEAVRLLLRQNASPEISDNQRYRPLTAAAQAGDNEAVEALALYSRNYLDDALFLAAINGEGKMIDTLTNYGASVYSRIEKTGQTPLMMAAKKGNQEAVRVLLENGANRYSTDDAGMTASQLAYDNGHAELAEYLGEEPKNTDFTLTQENPEILELAVKQVVSIEEQVASVPVTSNTNNETPLAKKKIKVVALNGKQLSTPATKDITETLSIKTYREETLPITVAAVDAKKVSIKYLYGDHKTVDVYPGETIPQTNLKVVSAKEMHHDTKLNSRGTPLDVSEVMVEDPASGQQRKMTVGLSVGKSQPFAVVKEFSGDSLLVAKEGDVFKKSDGTEFEVLEVRATQLVLMNSVTGDFKTIQK